MQSPTATIGMRVHTKEIASQRKFDMFIRVDMNFEHQWTVAAGNFGRREMDFGSLFERGILEAASNT